MMMRPYWEKSCSMSFWLMVLGSPLTYRFASRIEAELGRAYDTYNAKAGPVNELALQTQLDVITDLKLKLVTHSDQSLKTSTCEYSFQ